MPVDARPAVPVLLRKVPAFSAGRDRLVRWAASTVTALAALIAILGVSLMALALGLAS
jgi:hypothetical protein